MSYNIPIGDEERARKHNRQVHTFEEFKRNLRPSQKRNLDCGNRSARVEKQVRRGERGGMRAFTATLREDTARRLNEVPRGLKSANLEVLINRGWLWGQMWEFIYDLSEELRITKQQIELYQLGNHGAVMKGEEQE